MRRITEAVKHLIIIKCNILFIVTKNMLQVVLIYKIYLPCIFPKILNISDSGSLSLICLCTASKHLLHILFNMYGLWAFGTPLEQMYGDEINFCFSIFQLALGAGIVYTLGQLLPVQFSVLTNW